MRGALAETESAPTENHVDFRPRAFVTSSALTLVTCPDARRRRTALARRLESRTTATDSTGEPTPSNDPSSLAEYANGPQLWFGEYVSYGSGTERRYGIGAAPGHAS